MDMFHCVVEAPARDIDFCSVHMLSPHGGIDAVLDRQTVLRPSEGPVLDADIELRSEESADTARWVGRLPPSFIFAGDFNMPIESRIYRRDWANYRNAFSDAGFGCGYTEWPQIRSASWLSWGVRIDHVVTASGWRCRSCRVGPDVGSDHRPLIAELVWDVRGAEP
jgi:endonuclease/exonuclease/phosphatase family metal-dependent hydrolase